MDNMPMKYFNNELSGYDGNLQGFSLSSLTSGKDLLPILAVGAVAYYFYTNKGGGNVGSLIHKKTVEEQLSKVTIEASSKAEEKSALESLLSAEKAYNTAQQKLKDIRTGKLTTSGA